MIIGEFGNSTTGGAVDVNGDQVVKAVMNSGYGYAAWGWNPDPNGDQAVSGGQLTAYGSLVASQMGGAAAGCAIGHHEAHKPPSGGANNGVQPPNQTR